MNHMEDYYKRRDEEIREICEEFSSEEARMKLIYLKGMEAGMDRMKAIRQEVHREFYETYCTLIAPSED